MDFRMRIGIGRFLESFDVPLQPRLHAKPSSLHDFAKLLQFSRRIGRWIRDGERSRPCARCFAKALHQPANEQLRRQSVDHVDLFGLFDFLIGMPVQGNDLLRVFPVFTCNEPLCSEDQTVGRRRVAARTVLGIGQSTGHPIDGLRIIVLGYRRIGKSAHARRRSRVS